MSFVVEEFAAVPSTFVVHVMVVDAYWAITSGFAEPSFFGLAVAHKAEQYMKITVSLKSCMVVQQSRFVVGARSPGSDTSLLVVRTQRRQRFSH